MCIRDRHIPYKNVICKPKLCDILISQVKLSSFGKSVVGLNNANYAIINVGIIYNSAITVMTFSWKTNLHSRALIVLNTNLTLCNPYTEFPSHVNVFIT